MITEPKQTSDKKVKIQVVKEVPVQEIREVYNKQDGITYQLLTIEEALTELLNRK
jgi:hypothetical protein